MTSEEGRPAEAAHPGEPGARLARLPSASEIERRIREHPHEALGAALLAGALLALLPGRWWWKAAQAAGRLSIGLGLQQLAMTRPEGGGVLQDLVGLRRHGRGEGTH